MAPEMATGPIEKIGPASDIYLLGAILYEILTGKPPHSQKDLMKCLMAAARNEIAPTEKTGELVDIALKAMASEPEERYRDVKSFRPQSANISPTPKVSPSPVARKTISPELPSPTTIRTSPRLCSAFRRRMNSGRETNAQLRESRRRNSLMLAVPGGRATLTSGSRCSNRRTLSTQRCGRS